jgi:hypothetical protein
MCLFIECKLNEFEKKTNDMPSQNVHTAKMKCTCSIILSTVQYRVSDTLFSEIAI